MSEPSTTAAAMTYAFSGLALAQLLPYLDANAAFGAVIGAALVANTRKDLNAWRRLISFLGSAACGYGGAGEFVARGLAKESFLPALLCALIVVPVAVKVLALVPEINLRSLPFMRRLLGEKEQ